MKYILLILFTSLIFSCSESNKSSNGLKFGHYKNHHIKERITYLDDNKSLMKYEGFYDNSEDRFEHGTLRLEGKLNDNQRKGKWKFYNSNNELILTSEYLGGVIVQMDFSNEYKELFNGYLKISESDRAIISELDELNVDSDSISTEYSKSNFRIKKHWINGNNLRENIFRIDSTLAAIKIIDLKNKFELRREFCPSGELGFEGLLMNSEFNSISTWYKCAPNTIESTGLRINGIKVGIWFHYENNELMEVNNYGKVELIKELLNRRKNANKV